jgi:hypothetical protein
MTSALGLFMVDALEAQGEICSDTRPTSRMTAHQDQQDGRIGDVRLRPIASGVAAQQERAPLTGRKILSG